ncbi:peptide deformylase [Lawsonibacter faecis]|uniref:Peptide deformylase n=1 Tax=Lawsonibacter faecis TaxID=2763052 RepID=A0A8J6MD94_9FIRM|nr:MULTISPECIES: peptide deformylase [Oscillospiraceae]MTQ97383.1 peptide deformylase [Pseudoflavonifractor sp. BIOML-A16]MTR06413.1 peptide deformylase [Pseudoflavonifractor sp. BIOML-A15]MTR31688.1 peptide deformylase [Pseudoflavonifractor sp. BIOML-A14]MTR72374.1 peptide deformylase [Pseudoflavonifractor sp. BIOML-A18]MTS64260.1 peptide deformylase [Pseudoflavonifractor sp. BIOML-A5]MTS70776.1 peptide deformylase [Pseudoflavonifractor sp. BIOML-A8]MTS89476.1 peptide deformylase [Pseudofla
MSVRKIITKGDPVLGKKAHPVTQFDEKLHGLLDDMRDTLAQASGAGLAAPQVGILRRVVVISTGEEEGEILELVNPTIVATEGEQDGLEGCLSVPGYWGRVKRPMKATVRAQDRNGEWFERTGEAMTARCFCHEVDHLDGRLYTELVEGKLYTNDELEEMMEEQED